MTVLVACEESQAVCKAFRELGHEAFSCDILRPSGGRPEWHIKADVMTVLDGDCMFWTADKKPHYKPGAWDMILAFPPCTHLAASGSRWFDKKRADGRQKRGIEFFARFLTVKCPRVAIENPIGIIGGGGYMKKHFPELCEAYGLPIKPTQVVHPWQFGDGVEKTTCLWLKGLPPLVPTVTDKPDLEYFDWVDGKSGKHKRQPKWYYNAWALSPSERARARARTFPGIARAMAEQWGGLDV